MPNVGPLELVIVLLIALIIFGPKKLPQLGRSLGQGMREFKTTLFEYVQPVRLSERVELRLPSLLDSDTSKLAGDWTVARQESCGVTNNLDHACV